MVFGTFDGLHEGHLHFFKQAKKLSPNSFLIVSIARDKNVKKIKGMFPRLSEYGRMNLVKKSSAPDRVVLSGVGDHIPHIVRERPDVIALGYDQKAYLKNLRQDLKKKGLEVKMVRLKPYKAGIFKNHLLRKKR